MTRRVAVLTEIIAPYRIPVFNALAESPGIDLKVIFFSETDPTLRKWPVYKDEIRFAYEVLPFWRLRLSGSHLLLNTGLAMSLNKFSPDTVLCGGYNYISSWQALGWARKRRVPFVLWSESTTQDSRARHWPVEFLKKSFRLRCDGFVVPGKSAFDYLRSLGAPAKDISVAPNSVDNCFFSTHAEKLKAQPETFRKKLRLPRRFILFVGRFVPEKGVFDLLEAYAKLDTKLRSEVGLVLAGDGASKEELMRRAKQITPGEVCFPGFAHREDLAGLYAFAETLVLPTQSDPWGLVVNEGMACGLPIIVTNVAGCAADLVEDGWNGYVVPPKNSDRLKEAIESMLRQPAVTRIMKDRSLERIRAYSPEACASGLAAAALSTAAGTR